MTQPTDMPGRMSAVRSLSAEENGVRLHYPVGGALNGPPALLWHGFLEIGWKVGGRSAWLWSSLSQNITLGRIRPSLAHHALV